MALLRGHAVPLTTMSVAVVSFHGLVPLFLHILINLHLIINFANGRELLLQDEYVGGLLEVEESTHVLHPTNIRLERQM